jgi:hypothetical protein
MLSTNLLLEEPIRMASILEPSKTVSTCLFSFVRFVVNSGGGIVLTFGLIGSCRQNFFPAMTKIVGTLGPKSRSVDTISACLKAGMSGKAIPSSTARAYLFPVFLSFFPVVIVAALCQLPGSISRGGTPRTTRRRSRTSSSPSNPPRSCAP